jgi:DNA primase catalytic core
MIPQKYIEELLAAANIVQLIGQDVALTRSGRDYFGRCPFHIGSPEDEVKQSFSVSTEKNFYHCFRCNAHGSVLNFFIKLRGVTFVEAVQLVAAKTGFPDPVDGSATIRRALDVRRPLISALQRAAVFYERSLRTAHDGIAMLKSRGITGGTAKRFRVGYAPDAWDGLRDVLGDDYRTSGVDSGLVILKKDKCYDKMRRRLSFPQLSPSGEVHGMIGIAVPKGGRAATPATLRNVTTTLVSPASDIFGLFQAGPAIAESGYAIIVDDCIDVMVLAQNGFENVLCVPRGQAGRVRPRYVKSILAKASRIVCCFRANREGFEAAWITMKDALPFVTVDREIRFAMVPEDTDFASLLASAPGREAFGGLIGASVALSDFLLGGLIERHGLQDLESRTRAKAELETYCAAIKDTHLKTALQGLAVTWFASGIEVVCDVEEHDRLLVEVLISAKVEVVIVTPWITKSGTERFDFCRLVQAATARGVQVRIYTDIDLNLNQERQHGAASLDWSRNGVYANLAAAGADVQFVKKVHSKWVLRDTTLLAIGSFNWLSAAKGGNFVRHEVSVVDRGPGVATLAAQLKSEVSDRVCNASTGNAKAPG